MASTVRPALGDIGNRGKSSLIDTSAGLKAETYKNVKPRVDCWTSKTTSAPTNQAAAPKVVSAQQVMTRSKALDAGKAVGGGLVRPQAIATQRSVLPNASINARQSVRVKYNELPKLASVRMVEQPLIKSRTPQKQASVEMTETFMKTHSAQMLAQVEDIDENDAQNPQLVTEYVNDIYSYLYKLERDFPIKPNFLDGHAEVTPKMRAILIDWINEVHLQFKLEIESFHMAVSIIDRFLQTQTQTKRSKLQLVGVTALFFATKYEELFPPALSDFTYICDDCYKADEILDMEKKLFRTLKFNLSKPLSIHFLRRFSKAAKCDDSIHIFAKYITELAAVEYKLSHHHPSQIAAASLYLALKVFKRASSNDQQEVSWTPTLAYYSRYTNQELIPITKQLAALVKDAPKAKLSAVYTKYCSSKFDAIAKLDAVKTERLQHIIDY